MSRTRADHESSADHARELESRGFTVFESLVPESTTAPIRDGLEAIWDRAGRPKLYAWEDVCVGEGLTVSPVGMAVSGVLRRLPVIVDMLLHQRLHELFAEVLGVGYELEMVSGIVSDRSRAFFFWHNHIGGIDGEDYRGRPHPRVSDVERLACTYYASPLDAAHGTMLVHPRARGDATEAPQPETLEQWEGAIELTAPVGSVLVLDQCTWHSVKPMSCGGRRYFVGSFVRRAGLPATVRSDPSVAEVLASDDRVRRTYGGHAPR